MTEKEQHQYIRDNYLKLPIKTIARNIGRSGCMVRGFLDRNNLVRPKHIIERFKRQSQFKPGHDSWNKGKSFDEIFSPESQENIKKNWFQKGQEPHNAKADYEISRRYHKRGKVYYLYIRVKKAKWILLHRYVWELAFGPLQPDEVIQFKDGDCENVDLENLYVVNRKTLAKINKKGGYKLPYELRRTVELIYQLKSKIDEKQSH